MALNNTSHNTLKKHERLKSKKLLDSLFVEGKSGFGHPVKVIYKIEPRTENVWPLKFSVTVPKKKIKSAVKRNLVKRRIREAYRLNKASLQTTLFDSEYQLYLMLIYIEKEPLQYSEIEKGVIKIINKLANAIPS